MIHRLESGNGLAVTTKHKISRVRLMAGRSTIIGISKQNKQATMETIITYSKDKEESVHTFNNSSSSLKVERRS